MNMSRILAFIVVFGIVIALVIVGRNSDLAEPTPNNYENGGNDSYVEGGVTWQRYRSADLGLSFEYRANPNPYTLIERDGAEAGAPEVTKVFVLMDAEAYQELMTSSVPREGPPAISIAILDNPENLSPRAWVETHTMYSLFEISREITETTLGGAPAVRYTADGLYQNDMVVVSNNFKIYVISGAYNAPSDPIRADFQRFLSSLTFF